MLLGLALLVGSLGLTHPGRYTRDGTEYEQLAENLAKHNEHYAGDLTEPLDFRMYSKRPFGYPAIITTASLGNPALMKIVQVLLVLVLCLIGFELGKACLGNGNWLSIYLLLFALNLPLLLSSQFLMADLLLALIIGLFSLALIRFVQTKLHHYVLKASLLLVVGLCIKPVMLPLALLFTLLFVLVLFKLFIYLTIKQARVPHLIINQVSISKH